MFFLLEVLEGLSGDPEFSASLCVQDSESLHAQPHLAVLQQLSSFVRILSFVPYGFWCCCGCLLLL